MNFHHALKYLEYRITSRHGKGYGIHSPFVFDLITKVFRDRTLYDEYAEVEQVRHSLLGCARIIEVQDLGAGSTALKGTKRKIGRIAKTSSVSPVYGQLLFRLARYFQAEIILELGTSLGISTLYLAKSRQEATVHTIEGCPQTAAEAANVFKQAGNENIADEADPLDSRQINLSASNNTISISPALKHDQNIKLHTGPFDEKLPVLLKDLDTIDLIFFDGNHRKEPTLDYFRQCLQKTHKNSIFIFDDIYLSNEMVQAWMEIKNCNRVTLTIDIFRMGLVFFREGIRKQHFSIRF
ncbi:MAG: class I SAM-dependent methyltransferase [Bacteroidetes bacterium]|nr:class I SAM-dependent methyltransferase [Bacteroidota bacterium]